MPELDPADKSVLVALLKQTISSDPFPLSPRVKRLKDLVAKLNPDAAPPAVIPYPAPKPSGEPSLLYRKLRGGSRRR